ncbi:hypothetical protein [Carboxylicivirga marina]|uniref:DUF1700 domain-containing protein n=1 Tax=Carboxylicivirga marina TaxID=2800988 RepID=A0ABS1HE78_9BACT|nr:hypothetical protein [Carboxylicivirga marina]MBK3515964.1 hypothetical protein [Carboxylicivirga marina]
MTDLLKKLKLLAFLKTELEISKHDFISRLRTTVDEGETGMFAEAFDAFSSSKNEYKGHVGFDGFKIKRRRRFFDMNMNLAIAKGSYIQHGDKLLIDTEINGFRGMMIPFYIGLIIVYAIIFIAFLSVDNIEGNMDYMAIPFIIIHAVFMGGIPYLMMRRSVSRMKHELEREFFFLTK